MARGDGAYLLEESTADIFEVLVGNIPPMTRVNIWITYITELKIESDESTRFLLPTVVAPRYSPSSSVPWHCPWYDVFTRRFCLPFRHRKRLDEVPSFIQLKPHSFSVMIEIEAPSTIIQVVSPSHAIKEERTSESTSFVSFLYGDQPLGSDFILDYKLKDAHKARAIVECENEQTDRVSAMVTLVPDFSLADVKSELIFVVDQSGSMAGKFMEQAKNALQLFLRALPMDCYFNIIGFGSNFEKLFNSSQKYSQAMLDKAAGHVSEMSANLGGTEILRPLQWIFQTQQFPGYKRNIFLLTDGQVSNTEQVCKLIRSNSSKARLFSLGVGNQVSHDLVEGMARAGNGNAKFIVDGQRMDSTIMRQLKDSLQPSLTDISIDWGFIMEEEPIIIDVNNASKRPVVSGSLIGHRSVNSSPMPKPCHVPSLFCQTPYQIPPIFSGTRFIAYAFLKKGAQSLPSPRTITITAQSPDGPLSLQLEIEEHIGNLVQKLAARSLIRDLEEGSSWLHATNANNSVIKNEIVRLGTTYSLVSKHTSFIAVEPRNYYYNQPLIPQSPPSFNYVNNSNYSPLSSSYQPLPFNSANYCQSNASPSSISVSSYQPNLNIAMDSIRRSESMAKESEQIAEDILKTLRCQSVQLQSSNLDSLKFKQSSSNTSQGGFFSNLFGSPSQPPPMAQPQEKSAGGWGSFFGNFFSSNPNSNPNPSVIPTAPIPKTSYAIDPFYFEEKTNQNTNYKNQCDDLFDLGPTLPPAKKVVNNDSLLQSIVMAQQFDGSFILNSNFTNIIRQVTSKDISQSIPNFISSLANRNNVWATALVIALLQIYLKELEISWSLIAEKSKTWIQNNVGNAKAQSLLSEAENFFS